MNSFGQIISVLQTSLAGNASRTDGLRPLAWIVGMIITSLVATQFTDKADWLTVLLGVVLVSYLVIYAFSYLYCLIKSPDLLRSETYNIQKQAIDRGWIGDSSAGLFKAVDVTNSDALPESVDSKVDQSKIGSVNLRKISHPRLPEGEF